MAAAELRYPVLTAVGHGLISVGTLHDTSGLDPRGAPDWGAVRDEAEAGARSGPEGAYWRLLLDAALRLPQLNAEVVVADRHYWVDARWPELRLVAEVDGFDHPSSQQDFASDRRRQNDLHSDGLVVMRFPAVDVTQQPEHVVAMTRRMVEIRRVGR